MATRSGHSTGSIPSGMDAGGSRGQDGDLDVSNQPDGDRTRRGRAIGNVVGPRRTIGGRCLPASGPRSGLGSGRRDRPGNGRCLDGAHRRSPSDPPPCPAPGAWAIPPPDDPRQRCRCARGRCVDRHSRLDADPSRSQGDSREDCATRLAGRRTVGRQTNGSQQAAGPRPSVRTTSARSKRSMDRGAPGSRRGDARDVGLCMDGFESDTADSDGAVAARRGNSQLSGALLGPAGQRDVGGGDQVVDRCRDGHDARGPGHGARCDGFE